jgi:hypothetical protein
MEDPGKTTQKSGGGCEPCDLGTIDKLHCDGVALQEQADLITSYEEGIEPRRTKLTAARGAYSTSRKEAAAKIKAIDEQLKNLEDQLTCLLKGEDLDCLKDAYQEVQDKLAECGGTSVGCCAEDDCQFDDEIPEQDKDLVAKIAEIEARVAAALACFDSIDDEPADLTKRVGDLSDDVDELVTAVCDDPPADRPELYIRLLILQKRRKDVWNGFADVNAFYDCLCQALTCAVSGQAVLVKLKGEQKRRDCVKGKEKERCDDLRKDVVAETVAAYLRLCKCSDKDDKSGDDDCSDESTETAATVQQAGTQAAS